MTRWQSSPIIASAPHADHEQNFSRGVVGHENNASGMVDFTNSQSAQRLHIYVHFEFGVSWTPSHTPQNSIRSATCHSRGLYDRLTNVPREGPAPDTKQLADPALPSYHSERTSNTFAMHRQQHPEQRQKTERRADWVSLESQRWHGHSRLQPSGSAGPGYHDHFAQQRPQQWQYNPWLQALQHPSHPVYTHSPGHVDHTEAPPAYEEHSLSASSLDSRPFYQYAHLVPPPLFNNSRTVSSGNNTLHSTTSADSRYAVASSSSARNRDALSYRIWKDLPELPTRYRLGEDLPWSNGLQEPVVDPDDERLRPRSQPEFCNASPVRSTCKPFSNRPTVLLIQAPDAEAATRQLRDIDTQKKRTLENLSAAMVTVDNGFENQWWKQGGRTALHPQSPVGPLVSISSSSMSYSALPASPIAPDLLHNIPSDNQIDLSGSSYETSTSLPDSPTPAVQRAAWARSSTWAASTYPVRSNAPPIEGEALATTVSPISPDDLCSPRRSHSLQHGRSSSSISHVQQVVSPLSATRTVGP